MDGEETMANADTAGGKRRPPYWRIAGWGIAALLLLLPLVAKAPWTGSDYVFAAVLMGSVGLALELAVRMTRNIAYRAGVGAALAATFLTVWANGAVGMIGDEGNAFNLLFYGVVLVALVGAVAAGFSASGMSRAMGMAAIAQLGVSLAGLSSDPLGGLFSAGFAGLWLLSAALFWKADRDLVMAAASGSSD
jgi:hypothetical protein